MLVVLVIFAFLASVRATLVPAVTIPVAVIGAFIGIYALGFSINVLTLLALILAIGIVVDDAIVVLENIQRRIELGESPLVAGVLGTRQVTFAVIATSLTLIAVFVPISFLEGQVGRLFTEFGFVLAAAVAISIAGRAHRSARCCAPSSSRAARARGRAARLVERGLGVATRGYRALLARALDAPLAGAAAGAAGQRRLGRPLPGAAAGADARPRIAACSSSRSPRRRARRSATPTPRCARSRRSSARCATSGEAARVFAIVGCAARRIAPSWSLRLRRLGRARAHASRRSCAR